MIKQLDQKTNVIEIKQNREETGDGKQSIDNR
jgi:hypothetical protein